MRIVTLRVVRTLVSAVVIVGLAATVARAQTLPAPWGSSDVGAPAVTGAAGTSFTILGGGTDIWGTADQFRFVYQSVSGDAEVVARVASLTNPDVWAKAGVMFRASLTADSAHALMAVSAGNGYAFQRRPLPGGTSVHTAGGSGAAPGWVRLVRRGDLFEAYRSANGSAWTLVGSETIAMGETVYVGFAVTGHSATAGATASVDNFRLTAGPSTNQPPAVTITQPTNGTQVTAPATVTIAATASDPENRLASVRFYVEGTLIATDTTAPYSASWSASAAGTYSLTAIALDSDGGSTTSNAVSVTVNGATNQAPTVSLTAPANNATFTAPATIAMTATAADADGTVARVEFFNGTTLLGTDATSPYAFSWTSVAAGTYTLRAVAYDNAGANTSSTTVSVTVQAGNQPPTASLTSPANGATFTAPATIALAATAADPNGTVARVEFFNGTTLLGTDTSSPFTFSWTNVAVGTYNLRAVSYDNAGASGSSATVTVTVQANRPPTVALTSPANGATFAAPATIALAATASDPDGPVARVEFFSGTTRLATDTTSPYSFSWTNVAAGSYSITAVAFDGAGLSTTSAAVAVTVSATPVTPPRSVVFGASTDHATNVTSYLLSVFAEGADPTTATPVGTSDLGKPTPAANNDITVDRATFFSGLPAGNYVGTVTAIGPGGQTRSISVSFVR